MLPKFLYNLKTLHKTTNTTKHMINNKHKDPKHKIKSNNLKMDKKLPKCKHKNI